MERAHAGRRLISQIRYATECGQMFVPFWQRVVAVSLAESDLVRVGSVASDRGGASCRRGTSLAPNGAALTPPKASLWRIIDLQS